MKYILNEPSEKVGKKAKSNASRSEMRRQNIYRNDTEKETKD